MRIAAFALLVLAGCEIGPSIDLDHSSISVMSSPSELHITACPDSGLLGCGGGAGSSLSVRLDGEWKSVPPYKAGAFDLFPDRAFDLVVPPPVDDYVGVWLGVRATDVEQLPWFDIEWPETVRRGDGPVAVEFFEYPDAEVEASMTTECPNVRYVQEVWPTHPEPGRLKFAVADPDMVGTCTHLLQITQTIVEDRPIAIIRVSRTEVAALTSTEKN